MSFFHKYGKTIGFVAAFVSAGLGAVYPAHAAEFAGLCTTLLAAVGIQRPGDTKAE